MIQVEALCATEPMSTFAARVYGLRIANGLNQPELAKLVDCTKASIGSVEAGRTKEVKMLALFKMAGALHIGARWLATGDGSTFALGQIDEAEGRLIRLTRHCKKEQIDALIQMAKSFAASSGFIEETHGKTEYEIAAEQIK